MFSITYVPILHSLSRGKHCAVDQVVTYKSGEATSSPYRVIVTKESP